MAPGRIFHSVIVRLVGCLVLGGVVISIGLAVLEWQRSTTTLRMEVAQDLAIATRNLQGLLQGLGWRHDQQDMRRAMMLYAADPRIEGIRLTQGDGPELVVGDWHAERLDHASPWQFPEHGVALGNEVALDGLTHHTAPMLLDGQPAQLEFLINGAQAVRQLQYQTVTSMSMQWLLLAVMTLFGLLLVRRWITAPLYWITTLASSGAGAEPFYDIAQQHRGEFGQLAQSIGGMLTRISATTQRLHQREQAFADLYQFAPAAMISLDPAGRIAEANHRAAALLGTDTEATLIGLNALDYVRPEDRSLLRQTIDRLDIDSATRCELRWNVDGGSIDTIVECTGVRDEEGSLRQVRISLQDVTAWKQLQRQLSQQSRLLHLVIDHMSDGVLLVDQHNRVAAINQKLAAMVNHKPEDLTGRPYEWEAFWRELGPRDPEGFAVRLQQIQSDNQRAAQERFETHHGLLQLESTAVHDDQQRLIGRLWVVREMSAQEQHRRLLEQQTRQLLALRRMGMSLNDVSDLDDLLVRAAAGLYDVFALEAVGLAVRRAHRGGRSQQTLHLGPTCTVLSAGKALLGAVEQSLMPQVLTGQDVMFWPDPPDSLAWSRDFRNAGLTCVAAIPLRGSADAQGVVWIARRGGQRVETHHIHLLEALAPVIAARVEIALQRERMQVLQTADPVTDLPLAQQFNGVLSRMANRPGQPWTVLILRVDRFRELSGMVEHEVGDNLLRRVAHDLQRSLRKNCLVARLGGAKFAVLSPDTPAQGAHALAQRLSDVLRQQNVTLPDGNAWPVNANVSAASYPEDGQQPQDILTVAMRRLEIAKASGGENIVTDGQSPQRLAG